MQHIKRAQEEAADRHRRLFDLLRSGEISANLLTSDREAEPPRPTHPQSLPDPAADLSDLQRRAVESLLASRR
ncbi:hypothetical protein [Pseudooceanicola sp.]|uniref:hypothetical protein n=1 Tax=Pseudooceanicola sp. TaxID=1914328 RepID=UPI0035C6FFA2